MIWSGIISPYKRTNHALSYLFVSIDSRLNVLMVLYFVGAREPAAPAAGGGLSADQQQSKNHGNRRVSGARAARGRTFDRTGRAFRTLWVNIQ